MILNNDFNGAHKWNLGGAGREKGERRRCAPPQWSECESVRSRRGEGTLDIEREIKKASGSYSFRRLESVWGVHFQCRPKFKTQTGLFGRELCPQGSLRCE